MAQMTLDEKFGIPALLLIMALVVAAVLTSGNNYLEVTKFDLIDARQGERVMLDYERVIKRDFEGTWRVDLYRRNVWIAAAVSPDVHQYRTTAVLPSDSAMDLDWLTYGDPAFLSLPCGDYTVAVRWIINPESHIMRRAVEVSDGFKVVCE